LDDVSSLSSNVQVEDSGVLWNILWSVLDVEDVRSVLESSSVLSGINSEEEVKSFNLNDIVLVDRGLGSVGVPVDEFLVRSVSVSSQISSRDVVSESEDAIAVVSANATFFRFGWQGPVKEVVVDSVSVSKVVFSGNWSLFASRSRDTPGLDFLPLESVSFTISFGNWSSNRVGSFVPALESVLLVLRFGLVEVAPVLVMGEDSNISPWRWSPIWVVISLFRAFITVSVSIVVLSGESGRSSSVIQSSFRLSISNEKTLVSVSGLAGLVPFIRLVHSIEVIVSVHSSRSISIIRDSVGGGSISNLVEGISVLILAHVLNDDVAVHSWVSSTSVLSCPFDGKTRFSIVSQCRSPAITSFSVVLGVKQTVSVVSVCVGFTTSVVGASWIVQIGISYHNGQAGSQSESNG